MCLLNLFNIYKSSKSVGVNTYLSHETDSFYHLFHLTFKAPIITAADDSLEFFIAFQRK